MVDQSLDFAGSLDDLVMRASQDDVIAQRQLVQQFENVAFVAAYGAYAKPDRARLAGQFALGQVLLAIRRGVIPDNFKAYLRRSAVNAAITLRRRDAKLVHLEDLPPNVAEAIVTANRTAPDPEHAVWRRQVRTRILTALQRLPDRQRLAFTYVVLEGLSYVDAGEAMGCDSKTVGSQLFRARERLRELLDDLQQ
jgi:RNA polymerase sigma-70 factor (ECF subfamily)